jgi:phosphate transport system substrate-binding protein
MALRSGKCTNFGLCAKADTREAQNIPDGADFVCQECKRALTPVGGKPAGMGGDRSALPKVILAVLVLLVGGVLYFYFSRRTPGNRVASSGSVIGGTPLLRLSGSNTIGAELAPALAEAWIKSRGATDVKRQAGKPDEVRIAGILNGQPLALDIRAHGSKTAFEDLAAGVCDIGMASRKITPDEAAMLQAKGLGDLTSNVNEKVLGLDGVSVIVNDVNSDDSMSKDQVAAIFAGESTGKEWHIYARDDKSGTYDTFKDRVLGARSLVSSAKRIEDSRALVKAVADDRKGIGFVGLPYAIGVKVLAIAEKGAAPRVPNTMTVRTEEYPLSRRLFFYIPENASPTAREFVRFALSAGGQEVVQKIGFVGQKVEVMTQKTPAGGPREYVGLMPSSDRLSVDFRFRTGSSDLDTKAADDIDRVTSMMGGQFAGRGVMLVGFADNTGQPAANLGLSKRRAQAVAEQMQRRGIIPVLVTGFGAELPVADNGTPEGREKNRRVEVWLRK